MKIARQVALALCLAAIILGSWLAPLDAPAMQQVDAGLKKALVTFATSRAINGVISVLQGTQIDAQPGGIGLTFSPGQLLAPINELVKHFSNLMLMACVAFGIQKVLISISGYLAIKLVLTITALGWASFYFSQRQSPGWLSKMLVILLMLRFAIPVVALGSDFLTQRFMAADYAASQKAIETTSDQVTELNSIDPMIVDNGGVLNRMKGWMPHIPDVKGRLEKMKQAAEQKTEHMVKLMVIFLLQTLVMPLLLLWGLYGIARGVFERPRQSPA